MLQLSPSRQKLIIAKEFAKALHKRAGSNLKAVFAGGSVAADIAAKHSDIDVVAVLGRVNPFVWIKQAVRPKLNIKGKEVSFFPISAREFESYKAYNHPKSRLGRMRYMLNSSTSMDMLFAGAVPVFGREYANKHGSCWNYPNIKTIKKRYHWKVRSEPARLAFKRMKVRFLRP